MKIQWLGVQGTLSAAISDVDVTISSAGLADLPEVVAPDYAKLVIDPAGSDGRPEVVYVTAHAAAATTATISRGEETEEGGSVARSHADGAIWYHAATPRDYEGMVVAADQAERESLSVEDGTVAWQQDTMEHWTYVDAATPYWTRNNTSHQFIYNSSGSQGGNRFNDWSDLMTALTGEEGPKIILFEQDETIPSGSWDLTDVTLRGNRLDSGSGGFTVTVPTGVTFSSWRNGELDGIHFSSTSSSAIVAITNGYVFNILNNASIKSSTAAIFSHSGSGQVVFVAEKSSQYLDNGAVLFTTTASAFGLTLITYRGHGTVLDADLFASTNAVIYVDVIGSVGVDLATSPTPQSHSGLVVGFGLSVNQTFAQALKFDPTGLSVVTANNVQDAIEELDAVNTGGAGTTSPSVYDTSNIASSTLVNAFYMQVETIVTVTALVSITATSANPCTWDMDLPVASDLANAEDLMGMAFSSDGYIGTLEAEPTFDRARLTFDAPDTSARNYFITYTYEVI